MIYAVSDLHGYPLRAFTGFLARVGFTEADDLYVLGDAIDRGKDGVKLLQWMMRQPNVTFLLGNHEAMLLSCRFLFEEVNGDTISSLTEKQFGLLRTWNENDAEPTLKALRGLQRAEQADLLDYLDDAPLYETVSAGGRDFLLTHSGLKNFDPRRRISSYKPEELLWNRPRLTDTYFDDVITVFGHTPTVVYGEAYNGKMLRTRTWIDIDTGAGYGFRPALLRLDDLETFYGEAE